MYVVHDSMLYVMLGIIYRSQCCATCSIYIALSLLSMLPRWVHVCLHFWFDFLPSKLLMFPLGKKRQGIKDRCMSMQASSARSNLRTQLMRVWMCDWDQGQGLLTSSMSVHEAPSSIPPCSIYLFLVPCHLSPVPRLYFVHNDTPPNLEGTSVADHTYICSYM